MSEPQPNAPAAEPGIQFDRAEFDAPARPLACDFCNQPLTAAYFQIGDKHACPGCSNQVRVALARGPGFIGFLKAGLLGTLAAAAGMALYFGVSKLTGYELGLIGLVVGMMVGAAVRLGTGGRGGLLYQFMAVGLTYLSIALSHAPMIYEAMQAQTTQGAGGGVVSGGDGDGAASRPATEADDAARRFAELPEPARRRVMIVMSIAASLILPFIPAADSIIGWIIIGFSLFTAWRLCRRASVKILGPFAAAAPPQPPAPPPISPNG